MKVSTYKDWQEYKENKLASKQADNLYNALVQLRKKNGTADEFTKVYDRYHNSDLYKKHGALYCQVISDANLVPVRKEVFYD